MKTTKRMTAAWLCILFAASACLSSCGNNGSSSDEGKTTQPQNDTAVTEAETEEEEKKILDAIPDGTDFGGQKIRIRVNSFDQTQYGAEMFVMGPTESDGDIVHDAILERNKAVEERLNVEFEYTVEEYVYSDVFNATQKLIMSGEDVFDLFVDQQYGLLKIAAENMLYNFNENTINDFSQNYWWNEYMEHLQLGTDARYLVAGDYFLDVVETASAIFFNKAMYEEHYESANDLYQTAFDGKWTVDELGKYIKDFYSDVNGNGKVDEGDLFSMNLSRNYMDAQVFGSGIVFVERDASGFPVLNVENPQINALMEKIVSNYFEPKTTFNYATVQGVDEAQYYQNQRAAFANRQQLFLNDYLAAVKDLRDMKDDYGILPIPKFDESVESYRSVAHDTAEVGAIPTTCQVPDTVCTVLEALCSMSHNTSMKTYFESAMKVKYARDESTAAMIDLLHDSITQNFCYAFSPQINDYLEIFRALFDQNSASYTTELAKRQKSMNKKLERLITQYNENKED